jgi:maltose alpha-D-glucosyltransferase/alpha-amylase
MRRMLDIRSQHRAFGRGTLKLLYPNNRKVLAYLREYEDGIPQGKETILCVANVSPASQAVELDLSIYQGRVPIEMQGGVSFPPVGAGCYQVTLPPYGFYWLVLAACRCGTSRLRRRCRTMQRWFSAATWWSS